VTAARSASFFGDEGEELGLADGLTNVTIGRLGTIGILLELEAGR
jgi:hypothetical protein